MYLFLVLDVSETGRDTDYEGRKGLGVLSVAVGQDGDDAALPLEGEYQTEEGLTDKPQDSFRLGDEKYLLLEEDGLEQVDYFVYLQKFE